jgi:signal peptidase II
VRGSFKTMSQINISVKKKIIANRGNIFCSILILLFFFIDRLTKSKILSNYNEETVFINNFINIDLAWNTGIGFGLLSSNSSLIYEVTSVLIGVIILVIFYMSLFSNYFLKFFYSLIIGGALGNFYDRLTFKAVPDFLDLHYNNFHWFTFNVADIFITIGIIGFIIDGGFNKKI